MKVLLLGSIVSDKLCAELMESGIRPDPANSVQKYIIEGFNSTDKVESVDVISAVRIAGYHRTKIARIKTEKWCLGKAGITSLGYINAPCLNVVFREHAIVRAAKQWACAHKTEETLILVYSYSTPLINAASVAKRIIKKAKVILVVADLPLLMDNYKGIRRVIKQIDVWRGKSAKKSIDKYCLYTRYMANALHLKEGEWIVFEGLIDTSRISTDINNRSSKKRICVYAGSLDTRYAIDKLIYAFEKIYIDAELHIYGSPIEARRLSGVFNTCKKTKYMGMCTPDEIFEIMKEATLLINPRPTNLELSKYSCPSKTFEYMASGTPVLTTRLPGIPAEYEPYLYFFESETTEGFTNTINKVLSLEDTSLQLKGLSASRFLLEEKNSNKQIERILNLV